MKTLRKALDILEYAVLRGGGSVTPGEAAEATGVNPATATRILRALTERGYLVQVSRKRGYAPGPMVTSIGTRRNQFSSLAEASEAPLKELSARLGRQVNISVLDGSRRVMLRFCAPDPGFVCWDHFFFSDHWSTATGRLLIAALDDPEARSVCADCGIRPYPAKEIVRIRKDGFVRFIQEDLTVIGHWIRVPGLPAAAIGFGVPHKRADEAFRLSGAAAGTICRTLQRNMKAF